MNAKREALIFLKQLFGHTRRELHDEEYDAMRVILRFMDPVECSSSLHCWSEKYNYNGKIYEITGEISDPHGLPIIEELNDIEIPDK